VFLVYVVTHPYPALNGGLYLMMTRTIMENGYAIPAVIPHYTSGGIPFGFPPLGFYLAAVLLEAGVSELTIARLFPVVPFLLSLVAYYAFAEELLEERRAATFATVVLATSAPVLQYTISAGGFVRATALLFTVTGLYTGIRMFRAESWSWPWVGASVLLFGLTALTHPKYFLVFGVGYLALYARFDRTARGLVKGSAVLVGGLALSAPWWLQVVANHSLGLFLAASQTHGGIGNPLWFIGFLVPVTSLTAMWPVLVVLSGAYLVTQRRFFLPLWILASGLVVANDEYAMLVGALMIATLVYETIVPALRTDWLPDEFELPWGADGRTVTSSTVVSAFFIAIVVTYATGSAVLYVEDGLPTDDEFISFIDENDLEAMEWVQRNTAEDASFVVVGDAAEWFPMFADRTSEVAARGSAWDGNRQQMLRLRVAFSGCLSAECMTETIEGDALEPEFLYVSRDGYIEGNNRALIDERWRYLPPSMEASPDYTLVFENEDVLIYRYEG
jgi:hypothetical protein